MKKQYKIRLLNTIFFSLFFVFIPCLASAHQKAPTKSTEIRPPYDKIGYAWSPTAMDALLKYLQSAQNERTSLQQTPVAAICPHDDHLYAGHVYYECLKHIKAKEIVIFGVAHGNAQRTTQRYTPNNVVVLDTYHLWKGTYDVVKLSPLRAKICQELDTKHLLISNQVHAEEHSIEALIPFLQYFNKNDVKITPIIVPSMNFEAMDNIAEPLSEIIVAYIKRNKLTPGKDIFFLCSSDSSHYGTDFKNTFYGEGQAAHDCAVAEDLAATKHLLGKLTKTKISNFTQEGVVYRGWCGRYSVPFGMLVTEKIFQKMDGTLLEGKLIQYSDTLSQGVLPVRGVGMGVTARFNVNHWVGHLAVAYFPFNK